MKHPIRVEQISIVRTNYWYKLIKSINYPMPEKKINLLLISQPLNKTQTRTKFMAG